MSNGNSTNTSSRLMQTSISITIKTNNNTFRHHQYAVLLSSVKEVNGEDGREGETRGTITCS
jgi:hypothetical protein